MTPNPIAFPDLYSLLMMLRNGGGAIISSKGCGQLEILLARQEGRMFIDKDGFGFIYMPARKP